MKKWLLFLAMAIVSINAPAQDFLTDLMQRTDLTITEVERRAEIYFNQVGKGRGSMYKQFQRWLYERKFHLDENGYFISPETEWNRFLAGRNSLRGTSNYAGNWTLLGPTTWVRTSGWNPGNGRLSAFAIHPANESIIYVGSPGGGVWKTTNAGGTWTPLTDGNNLWMNVFSLAIDPVSQNTIYAGMDNGVIIKSTNAGTSFTSTGSGPLGLVRKILIHPTNPDIVFACAQNGIFRSINGGTSWTNVHGTSKEDIEFKTDDPNIMIATGNINGSHVVRSVNNGVSWTTIGIAEGIVATGRTLVSVTPANPNIMYVVQASGSLFGRMYKSIDAGLTFITTVTGSPGSGTNFFGYESDGTGTSGQATYDMAMDVSNTNANDLYIGGINVWRSVNGGTSFTPLTEWSLPNTTGYTHADIHGLFRVNTNIYSISDGGIYKSTDNGDNWTDLTPGMAIKQLYRIANSQTNDNVITAGAQDNGTSTRRAAGNWVDWLGADGMEGLVSPTNHLNLWGTSQYGSIYRSTNGGSSYTNLSRPNEGNWVTPLCIHPTNETILYGGWQGVWKSVNSGINWTNISPSITNKIIDLAIAPSAPTTIYASVGQNLHVTTNDGTNWTTYNLGLTANDIAVDPTNPQKVWIATNNSASPVMVSTNGGASFTNVTGLPVLSARSVIVDDNTPRGIYVALNLGIYYKQETDAGWTDFSTNLPKVAVNEIEIQKATGKIRAATYGRAIWESPVAAPPCTAPGTQATNIVFTSVQTNQVTVNWTNGNGSGRILVGKSGSAVAGTPANGTTYTGNVTFGSGQTIAANEFVLYSGTGPGPITITNLNPSTTYHFKVFEYNCSGTNLVYQTSNATNNPASQATNAGCTDVYETNDLCTTATIASAVSLSNTPLDFFLDANIGYSGDVDWYQFNTITCGAITLTLSNLPYDYDMQFYGSGATCSSNLLASSENSSTLNETITYNVGSSTLESWYVKVYPYLNEFTTSSCYRIRFQWTPVNCCTAPSTQASNIVFSNVQQTQMTVNWTNGNGEGRIGVIKAGSPITGTPANGTVYTLGQTIAPSEQVFFVGNGAGTAVLTGLSPDVTYYISIFEYNCTGSQILYNNAVATGNPNSQATVGLPDLLVTGQNISPLPVVPGVSFTVSAGELNQGTGPANTNTLDVWFSTDANFNVAQDIFLAQFVIPGPLAGNSSSGIYNGNVQVPSTLCPGTYYLFFRADASQVIAESNENNNLSFMTFTVNPVAPTVQAAILSSPYNFIDNTITVTMQPGNGSRRIVKMNTVNSFTAPVNGTDPSANNLYSGGEQVVYNGTGTSATITGLSQNTNYCIRVYEANCTSVSSLYNVNTTANNTVCQTGGTTAPDLTSSQLFSTTQVSPGTTIDECIVIRNVGTATTSAPIVFGITNYSALSGLTITLNNSPTVQIGIDTYVLDNTNWTFNSVAGTITSNAGITIAPGGAQIIGIRITRNVGAQAGANGTVTQTTTISAGTGGGDNVILNNSISNSILKY